MLLTKCHYLPHALYLVYEYKRLKLSISDRIHWLIQ